MAVLVNLVVMVLAMNIVIKFASARESIILLSMDKSDKLVLNPDALSMLKRVSGTVRVIAAIGDARVGKSTALNFLRHSFEIDFRQRKVEKVFETGSKMTAVTRGVWLSFVPDEGMLLLDVEGTDLGNDEHTTKLSIFTALMSSSLMVFMKENPSNHIFEFLYKICRVSENLLDPDVINNFPRLIPVMRGALETPEGYSTTADYIKEAFTKPNPAEKTNQGTIGKFFPKETMEVFELPYVKNFDNDSDEKEYLERILRITRHLRETPQKKTLRGGEMDGKGLAKLAEKLVNEMNTNKEWKSRIPNLVVLFEKDNCLNGFNKHIEPLLSDKLTVEEIKQKRERQMHEFERICTLEDQIGAAQNKIRVALKAARKREEKRKSESSIFYEYFKYGAGAVGGILLHNAWAAIFSDVRLKQDIVPVSGSEYALIGLQGVQWTWNEEARRLGLNGVGEGVVAQEVEKLFPWAVTEGYDGYKRVNYLALKIMIKWKSLWK